MGDGGVVDGQNLQHTLAREGHPVDHLAQVAEVTHAETALRPEREHGHERTGAFHMVGIETGLRQLIYHHIAIFHHGKRDYPVVGILPDRRHLVVIMEGDELHLEQTGREFSGIDIGYPLVVVVLHHHHGILGLPVAQYGLAAHNGQPLIATQLWRAHLQPHGAEEGLLAGLHPLVAVDALGHGRTVEIGVVGDIYPVVVYDIARGLACRQFKTMGLKGPFAAHFHSVTCHGVEIVKRSAHLE